MTIRPTAYSLALVAAQVIPSLQQGPTSRPCEADTMRENTWQQMT